MTIERIAEQIQAFRVHLASPKFAGTETIYHCMQCDSDVTAINCGDTEINPVCLHCSVCDSLVTLRQERKDWIATADVNRWLDQIESTLEEE